MLRLPDQVSRLITASNTIPTLSHAVEELVLNSIDALATTINITLDAANFRVEVSDNGEGIDLGVLRLLGRVNVTLARSRMTFGRSGNTLRVLSGICSLEIHSRHRTAAASDVFRAIIRDGLEPVISRSPRSIPAGTVVVVQDMFSGVPVRRALLRESNELDKITRRLGALMLIIPQASVTVVDTSRQMTVLSLPRVNSVLERIYSLHSSLRNTKLVAVDWYDNDLLHHVAGWVSRPSDSTGSTSYHLQRIHVNHRPVKSSDISSAMNALWAAKRFGDSEARPSYVLDILCPEECYSLLFEEGEKARVEFRARQDVIKVLNEALSHAWAHGTNRIGETGQKPQAGSQVSIKSPHAPTKRYQIEESNRWVPLMNVPATRQVHQGSPAILSFKTILSAASSLSSLSRSTLERIKVIGQVDRKFIVCAINSMLIAIDQHAAHERVRLEALRARYLAPNSKIGSQPVNISLPLEQSQTVGLVSADWNNFSKYGWKFEFCLQGDIRVRIIEVPTIAGQAADETDFLSHIEHVSSGNLGHPRWIENLLASKACRGAIMFGDTLSFKTCDGLIKKLTRCKNPFECAHGRPTMVPLCNIDEISSVACTGGGVG